MVWNPPSPRGSGEEERLLDLVGNPPSCSGEEERLLDLVGDPLRVPGGEEVLLADQSGTQSMPGHLSREQ